MGATWHKLGGWDGLLCGSLALYLSFAEVTNSTWGRPAIPIGGPIIKS
jgi:succinate-acetate transporter protein